MFLSISSETLIFKLYRVLYIWPCCAKSVLSTTVPNPPRNLRVVPQNKTHISLYWDVPEDSDGVTIQYRVSYNTTFWGESSNLGLVNKTNVTVPGLRPGTEYNFNVSVFAGNRNSETIHGINKTGKWLSSTVVICTIYLYSL